MFLTLLHLCKTHTINNLKQFSSKIKYIYPFPIHSFPKQSLLKNVFKNNTVIPLSKERFIRKIKYH